MAVQTVLFHIYGLQLEMYNLQAPWYYLITSSFQFRITTTNQFPYPLKNQEKKGSSTSIIFNKMEEKALIAASSPTAEGSPATADVESAAVQSQKLRRKKHLRLAAFVALVIIFHAIVITVLDLTILKIRRPNYRLSTITIENLIVNNSTNSPSFLMDFDAEIAFKNRNFGPYTFEFGYLTFSYMGTRVGDAVVDRSSVKMYSRKSMNLKVKVTSQSVGQKSNLRRDITSVRVTIKVDSELRGQVGLMKVFKNDRAVKLNCSFTVDLAQKSVQELSCD
ncbi:hypothetical protein Pfo_027841 [Paulownia fortunei]|nr:hypothetical protein Pfo_027841 [Paulownia fortunei]